MILQNSSNTGSFLQLRFENWLLAFMCQSHIVPLKNIEVVLNLVSIRGQIRKFTFGIGKKFCVEILGDLLSIGAWLFGHQFGIELKPLVRVLLEAIQLLQLFFQISKKIQLWIKWLRLRETKLIKLRTHAVLRDTIGAWCDRQRHISWVQLAWTAGRNWRPYWTMCTMYSADPMSIQRSVNVNRLQKRTNTLIPFFKSSYFKRGIKVLKRSNDFTT